MVAWSKGLRNSNKKFFPVEALAVTKKTSEGRFLKAGKVCTNPQDTATHFHHTTYEHLCYHVDTWISRRRSQALALTSVLLLSVLFFGGVWTICFRDAGLAWYDSLFEGLWIAWTFMADPGTHADEHVQSRRIVGAAIAVGGIFFMAVTLGLIVDLIRAKMESLRQGKSDVVERGHSLILGWSEKAIALVEELCNANESVGGGAIVVLSNMDKETVEKDLAMQMPPSARLGTKIIFRTGNPMLVSDLLKVGAPTARATVILSNDGDADNSDAETLRVMLSLRTMPYELEGHVVAEVRDIDNEGLVKMVGGSAAETVVSHDILGRLMLMSARQPGLAKAYECLLGFQGDEFYISEWPELVGVSFGDLMERFPDAVPIGICTDTNDLILNPDPSRILEADEKIIVIAEDDDTYQPEDPEKIEIGTLPERSQARLSPEKILFCGWRRDIRDIVTHLDSIVELGSEIHMITASVPLDQRTEVLLEDGLDIESLKNIKLVHHFGNPSVRRRLAALPLSEFASCMIFADQAFEADSMNADSHSLATLLLLRDLQSRSLAPKPPLTQTPAVNNPGNKGKTIRKGSSMFSIRTTSTNSSIHIGEDSDLLNQLADTVARSCPVICEVLDPRTAKTISFNPYVQASSEFCQTNKITAQILAMVSESRQVNALLDELLGSRGNSVNVYPSEKYMGSAEYVSFWTLAKRAAHMSETLIGFLTPDSIAVVNPGGKSKKNNWEDFHMIVISLSESDLIARNGVPPEETDPQLATGSEDGGDDAAVAFQAVIKAMSQKERIRFAQAMRQVKRMVYGTVDLSLHEGVHASTPRSIEVCPKALSPPSKPSPSKPPAAFDGKPFP